MGRGRCGVSQIFWIWGCVYHDTGYRVSVRQMNVPSRTLPYRLLLNVRSTRGSDLSYTDHRLILGVLLQLYAFCLQPPHTRAAPFARWCESRPYSESSSLLRGGLFTHATRATFLHQCMEIFFSH